MSEIKSEDEFKEETMTRMVVVPLDIHWGEKFSTFKQFQEKLHKTAKAHFVRFSKRDSRTIEAARRKIKRHIKPALEYYQLRYSCFFSQKNRPKGTGKRNRISVARQCEVSCPASISVRATEDGEYLEVYNIVEMHNHPVSETEYQRLLPKKRATLVSLFEGSKTDKSNNEDDKYKAVLKKCRFIARLASVSETKSINDILRDLDDYIYYLKYTTPKEVLDRLKEKRVDESNSVGMEDEDEDDDDDYDDDESMTDESIQIIVETDSALTNN